MGKYDDLFDAAPSPTPAVVGKYSDLFDEPEVVATQPEGGDGFLAKINAALRKPSPAWLQAPEQATRELVQGMLPHDLESYAAGIFPPLGAYEQGKALAQGDVSSVPFIGRIPEIAQAEDTPAGSKERYLTAMKTIMDLGMLAGAGGERAPSPLRTEPIPTPDLPPSPNMGPGTIAGDVSKALERRFTLQEPPPEAPPDLAPSPPIEQTLPRTAPPIISPETGFGHYPTEEPTTEPRPVRTEFGRLPGGADLKLSPPPPPPGTPLKPVPLVGPNGSTPAMDVATQAVSPEAPVQAPGGAALRGVPVAETPQTPVIPPEDVKYTGGGSQTEVPGTVGISQARTEAELGPGSVVPGAGAEMGSGLAYGREYVNKGGDPRLPIRRANTSGMVGKNDVGIVHAELDRLRVERNKAAAALEANPVDPVLQQNFSVADDAQRAWRKELQPVLTKASDALREAHAASMPDADVGTYQGLADLMDEHFKGERTLSPEERTALAKAARGVKESRNIANGEMAKVEGTLEQQVRVRGKKMMSPEELEASIRNRLETDFTDCVLGA